MKTFLLFLLGILTYYNTIAQSIDEVFDDGGISTMNSSIGISANDLLAGILCIQFEHLALSRYSFIVKGGYTFFDGIHTNLIFTEKTSRTSYYNPLGELNYSFVTGFQIRGYIEGFSGWFTAIDIGYRYQNRSLEKNYQSVLNYLIGYKWTINHFSIEPSTGFGLIIYGYKTNSGFYPYGDMMAGFNLPININLAFNF